jgi:hypothetical protein
MTGYFVFDVFERIAEGRYPMTLLKTIRLIA